jgi:multidrug resistance efflux pump
MDDLLNSVGAALDPEARLWAAFATAGNADALCRSWLGLQCRQIADVQGAMLLLSQGGPFRPVAMWPDASQDLSFLRPVAEQCLKDAGPVVRRPPHDGGATGIHIAYPFLGDGEQPVGAVVLDIADRGETAVRQALRQLHWGVGWLEAQAVRDRVVRERERVAAAAAALDLVALANEHDRPDAAGMAVANELAVRLGAARVAIGLDAGGGARVIALSHTAWFKRRSAMVRALETAMDEAMDQRATVRLPAPASEAVRIQVAHEALRAVWEMDGACTTFPLLTDRGPAGAITVLHKEPPPDAAIRLGEAASALLGPILYGKRRARRWVSGRLPDALRDGVGAAIGPRHLAVKFTVAAIAVAVTAAVLVPAQFRVSAKAVLEGKIQRAVPVPFEGFIATAPVHAGDMVREGDVLATMDDKDLQLDRVKWDSEKQRLQLKIREAQSKHDPATAGQLAAELRETEAQADLAAAKLERAAITSPIDGLVVSGDLTQQLGAPVETGKLLFEVAPLDAYRVTLRMDERDIRFVRPGQRGRVLLHGMTGQAVRFTVKQVASVAEIDNGHNTFRVEGALDTALPNLRPGMEGVAKVSVGHRSYAGVWTRGLLDWARMEAWSWLP